MEASNPVESKEFWKQKIKQHWLAFSVTVAAIVLLSIVAVVVFVWMIDTSPIGLKGMATFDQWSLDWVVRFGLLLIAWELLFVGLPGGLYFGLGGYLWWRRLPLDEKSEFRAQNRREQQKNHRKSAGGAFSLFLFIAYCIFIAIDGNYYAEFGSQPYSYWVLSYLVMIGWLLIIVGIPAVVIGLIWYINKARK